MLKRLSNRSKDYILFNPALEGRWLRAARGKVTALLYHRVDAPSANGFLSLGGSPVIAPTEFDAELRYLVARGARFFTFGQLADGDWPAPGEFGVAICFDDCFADNYTTGLQVLARHRIPATFFQSTAMIDAGELLWEHKLYWHTRDAAAAAEFREVAVRELGNDPRIASLRGSALAAHLRESVRWDDCLRVLASADARAAASGEQEGLARRIYPNAGQLRRARAAGHEIGSHGHRHCMRSNISAEVFEGELQASRDVLSGVLGEGPQSFSYPFDSHLPEDAEVCRRYFKMAATVAKRRIERNDDPMWLPRFTWPGPTKNSFRRRRWLLTGTI